ncbi:heavy metal-binding protein HIP-like, partial [Mytilus californianus]|uniref:heavy metal-binding protein HIP-like n=1 Tax=Mytilus californianus TaxID=6549 RepID=UPI00224587F5
FESTKKEVKQVKVELESTRNELKQVKVELESTRNELKQVKVELDTTKEQIDILRKEMIEKDSACRKEINQIRPDVNALREELNKIKTENKEHNGISFSARLGTSMKDIDPWNTVVFDKVISNDGNSYNAATGIFTAPMAGTYYFTATIFTRWKSQLEMSLKVNEQNQMWMYPVAATTTGNTGTNSIIVKLKKEDKVRLVKNGDWGTRPFYIHHSWSTFSGFLL